MRGFIGLLFLVFVGLFIYFAFIKKDEPISTEKIKETATEVKRKAQEVAKNIGKLDEEKEQLLKKATDELTGATRDLDSLKRALEKATNEKKEAITKQIQELEETKKALEKNIETMKGAGEEAWQGVRQGFETAIDALKRAKERAEGKTEK